MRVSDRTASFAFLVAQLGLILVALWRFRIEESYGFLQLVPLIFVGFIVHSLLPPRYRQPFFLALSLAGITVVLPFPHSLILVGLGLGLVGVCHLPVPFRARVGVIVLVGSVLASVRAGWIALPSLGDFQSLVLPVLGAMFMFRLAIYLYDIRHEKTPSTVWERLSYFFLLPNVSFLLFPVVDYQTFRRTYYNADEHAIYQKGLLWMTRGLIHLLLYRLVYQHLVPTPGEVQNLATVAQFAVTSYLLYLRISGQFHLIIGILCLFGFNLPETHHRYFLASGFTDFWRRINIYWKDFMLKMIYYPVFVPLRKRYGMKAGIILATVMVFLSTWLLHSYQWFWLRGSFPIHSTDGLFWGFLGAMVVVNSLWEARSKKTERKTLTLTFALARSAKTVGFFSLMCLLWSLWSSATPGEWLGIVSRAGRSPLSDFGLLAAVLAALIAGGAAVQFVSGRRSDESAAEPSRVLWKPALQVGAVASLLLLISTPFVRGVFDRDTAEFVLSLRQDRLNVRDQEVVDRGYYEGLLEHGHFTSALWSARTGRDLEDAEFVPIVESRIVDQRDDILEYELKASFVGTFKNAPFTTNRWRMRGGEYAEKKPQGTYRLALVGASYEMAGGVEDHETFAALLEQSMNETGPTGDYSRFEILNFSVAGYSMIHKAIVVEQRTASFEPDVVVVTLYSTEEIRLSHHVVRIVENQISIPYPQLREIVERSGARPWMPSRQIRAALEPHLGEIVAWSLRHLDSVCRDRGVPLVLLFMPTTTDRGNREAQERLRRLSNLVLDAGLEPVLLGDVYGGHEMSDIQLSRWDSHLNVLGNRLMADGLHGWVTDYLLSPLSDRTKSAESGGSID